MARETDEVEALQLKDLSEMVRKAMAVDNVILLTSKWHDEQDAWNQVGFYNHMGDGNIPIPHAIRMLMQALVQLMLENRNPNVDDKEVMNTMFKIFYDVYMQMKRDLGSEIDANRTPGGNIH